MSDPNDTSSDVEFDITAIYIGSIFEMIFPLILTIFWIIFLKGKKGQKFLCTLFGIIGFSLGSVLILYPGYSFNLESLIGIFLLFLGFLIGKNIKK